MRLTLIRHGKTKGNLLRRYIGTTDEPLCLQGQEEILALVGRGVYPKSEVVYTSPKLRCVQTAKLIYPNHQPILINELREMDFGLWENQSYEMLKDDALYQQWLDSGGSLPFPNGEGKDIFCQRCAQGWENCMEHLISQKIHSAAFVVHGGTIMAVLSQFTSNQDYYSWQVCNGCGYLVETNESQWQEKRLTLTGTIGGKTAE